MHVEQTGCGPDLFLIHGWMMNRHCWRGIVAQLRDRYRLTTVDLPGHGDSLRSSHSLNRPEQLIAGLLELAPQNATWVGWSLGGLLAQLAAQAAPDGIRSIINVGMSARYMAAPDWPCGVNRVLFKAVRQLFAVSPEQIVRQLIERQVLGSERQECARAVLSSLAAMPWDKKELKAGLELLKVGDARPAMQTFKKPVLFIAGEKDLIINNASLEQSSRLAAHGRYVEIAGAGHAPFLSHHREFVAIVDSFIDNSINEPN